MKATVLDGKMVVSLNLTDRKKLESAKTLIKDISVLDSKVNDMTLSAILGCVNDEGDLVIGHDDEERAARRIEKGD